MSDQSEWIVRSNNHEAIVSREVFDQANAKMFRREMVNQHHYESPYLLTGLITCSKCGFRYIGQSYKRDRLYYYIDGGNASKGEAVCKRHSIRQDTIEPFVIALIQALIAETGVKQRLEEMINGYLKNDYGRNPELERLEKQLEEVKTSINRVLNLVASGVRMDTALDTIRDFEERRERLQEAIQKETRTSTRPIDVKDVAKEATDLIERFRLHFDRLPIQEKKQLVRQFVLSIRVYPDERIARVVVTKIPTLNQAFLRIIQASEDKEMAPTTVGAERSGGPL